MASILGQCIYNVLRFSGWFYIFIKSVMYLLLWETTTLWAGIAFVTYCLQFFKIAELYNDFCRGRRHPHQVLSTLVGRCMTLVAIEATAAGKLSFALPITLFYWSLLEMALYKCQYFSNNQEVCEDLMGPIEFFGEMYWLYSLASYFWSTNRLWLCCFCWLIGIAYYSYVFKVIFMCLCCIGAFAQFAHNLSKGPE